MLLAPLVGPPPAPSIALVFGVSAGSGGLVWFIYENRNQLLIADVFAGLLTAILIGFAVEGVIFRAMERVAVQRWGMQR